MKKDQQSLAAWGMLSVIVTQLVVAPGVMGGVAYFICLKLAERYGWDKSVIYIITLFAALVGLVLAFYRINQITNRMDQMGSKNDSDKQ